MAKGVCSVIACVIVILIPVTAGDRDCKSYRDLRNEYHSSSSCYFGEFCCGTCENRYCCRNSYQRFSEDEQENCFENFHVNSVTIGSSVAAAIILMVIFISCCCCPCCCLYKICRKPRPVIATTTHTTMVTNNPPQYPQQPPASQAGQGSFPGYQPVPVQPGYGANPMPQTYGGQAMPQGYGGQPMATAPYQGQPYMPGPPPPYQEAMGPACGPPPMAYSQAAYSPGHSSYPLQPPGQPQPQAQAQAQPPHTDLSQPAYNPAYAPPPPKAGY